MKLHLPIALLLSVSASMAFAADYEVGTHTGGNNLPSKAENYKVYDSDVTLGTGDRMGTFKNGALVTDAGFGKEQWSYGYKYVVIPYLKQDSAGTVTKNVQVKGTLTLNGDAQVSLGGQYKSSTDALNVTSSDEFTGLLATNVVVNDTASLNTWNAIADNITVNGGTVNIHTYRAEGNMGYRLGMPDDSKQVQIKQSLNVTGGTVTIGHGSYNNHTNPDKADTQNPETDYHTVTAFGSYVYEGTPTISDGKLYGVTSADRDPSIITQSGGTLTVRGKSLSVGGLNIEQTGGTMSISEGGKHFIADYGDSQIQQNSTDEKTSLKIGAIKAFNTYYSNIKNSLEVNKLEGVDMDPTVSIVHSGAGYIQLNGVDFTPEIGAAVEHSKITQNDYVDAQTGKTSTTTGSIDLQGEYKGVVFDIEQNGGGKINIKSDLSAGSVKQQGGGTITVDAGKTLTAESILIEDGTFVNKGTVNGAEQVATASLYNLVAMSNSEDMLVTIAGGQVQNYGTFNGDIAVAGGTLELMAGAVGGITMTSGDIVVQSNSTTGNLTLEGGTITFKDGAVLTLSAGAMVDLGAATIIVEMSSEEFSGLGVGTNVTLFDSNTNTAVFDGKIITFTDGTETMHAAVSGGVNGGQISIAVAIPEPTTATLSLLALAGLAARRRR